MSLQLRKDKERAQSQEAHSSIPDKNARLVLGYFSLLAPLVGHLRRVQSRDLTQGPILCKGGCLSKHCKRSCFLTID